ncbi:ATP-binding protein [Rhodobacteraceae bacterium 63075]|nr:ATP-binding protein [Rhodobacteraceae bacterium 63075]
MSLSFSPQQSAAHDTVAAWLKFEANKKQIFRLFGYAGTGKTTLARHLADGLDGPVVYAAFTGKAALMMQKNGCQGASTIHRLIYKPVRDKEGRVTFKLNRHSAAAAAALIVVDECSMVDKTLARDLMSFKTPILALGDPAQLPPVKGAGFFTEATPDAMLTEVHRQAQDSPVLRLATAVREGRPLEYGVYGDSKVVPDGTLDTAEILKADQLIVGRNTTRHHLNSYVRHCLGYEAEKPVSGDRLVCLKNDYELDVFNGGMFEVVSDPKLGKYTKQYGMKVISEDYPDEPAFRISVKPEFFKAGEPRLSKKDLAKIHQFTFGYALTAHKAQGSQWNNVVVDNESWVGGNDPQKWLYTAITRARERVTVVGVQ